GPEKDTMQILNIHPALFKNSLIIRLRNGKKIILKKEKIWGYQDEKGIYYRYENRQFYKVEQLDTIMIYSRNSCDSETNSTDYYFSKNKNSEIYTLSRKNLKKEFAQNSCFVEKLDKYLKWYNGFLSFDNNSVGYIIVTFYKQCI
ncbi:MAG: hypothetical protein ACXVDZ_05355, partial [Bacteroidia bacterium]